MLKALDPAALLLTGDLVDGKSNKGQGRQSLTEWQVRLWLKLLQHFCSHTSFTSQSDSAQYASGTDVQDYRIAALESFKANAGLPEKALLDVRGNHDTFNVADR